MSFLLVAGFSVFSVQLYRIQIVRHGELSEKAAKERMRKFVLPSNRGLILDRRGNKIVLNKPVQDVLVDRTKLLHEFNCVPGVAHAEGIDARDARERYSLKEIQRRYVTRVSRVLSTMLGADGINLEQTMVDRPELVRIQIAKDLSYDKALRLKNLLEVEKIGGVYFDDGMQRFHPNPTLLSNVAGYIGEEDKEGREGIEIGLAGIEREWEDQLRGIDGYRYAEVGGNKREIAAYRGKEVLPQDGNNVSLTIDMGFQMIVEEILDKAVAEYSPERIMAVFMNPMTGEILAMAARPGYNQHERRGELMNLCVSHTYEPGSVFKIVTVAAALDSGMVNSSTPIFCHNRDYRERGVHLVDHGTYGDLTPPEILQKSSNIGAYMLAKQIGAHALYNYTRNFGFGTASRVRLPNENKGAVINPGSTSWSDSTLSVMAMGYSIDVSPLQIANAISTIANGGNLMRPYIVKNVVNPDGKEIYRGEPHAVRRVISERTTSVVRQGMIMVTGPEGTAKLAAMDYFTVAGKTGTAQKAREDALGRRKGYWNGEDGGPKKYVVSFGGFLPAENPVISGIIIVDDPKVKKGPTYGGTVAAPIFKEIAERAMPYLGVEPTHATSSTKRVLRTVRRAAVARDPIPVGDQR